MSHITGWILDGRAPAGAGELLARMIGAVQPSLREAVPTRITACSDTLALATDAPNSVCRIEPLLIAWTGEPHWRDDSRRSEEERIGFGDALYRAWLDKGADCLENLRGRFSLVVLDTRRRVAYLALDRLGVERLLYVRTSGGFLFGTSLAAFRAFPGHQARIDPQAVYDYLYFHMVPSPRAIYSEATKLRPRETVMLKGAEAEGRLRSPLEYGESDQSEAELAEQLTHLLEDSVKRSIRRAPIAAFLSGGLDSSTVVGLASVAAPSAVTAFCVGFDAQGYDETPFARKSAKHFEVPLVERYVTPDDVLRAIDVVADAYDEPFGNASAVPAFFCALAAKERGFETILAGDGGDEIFGGNERYARQALFELYTHVPSWLRKNAIEPLVGRAGKGYSAPLKKLRSYVDQARIPLPERLETYNLLNRFELQQVLTAEMLEGVNTNEPRDLLNEPYRNAVGADTLKRMMHLDLKLTLADNDLRKVSRMCEWAGIEVAYPMLDEELVEFAASVPSHRLIKNGELRAFYKRALSDFLPPHTQTKTKHGFGLPFGIWLASDSALHDFAIGNLRSLSQRGIVKPDFVTTLLSRHAGEHASYYGVMIWLLLVLERWLCRHGHDV